MVKSIFQDENVQLCSELGIKLGISSLVLTRTFVFGCHMSLGNISNEPSLISNTL